MRPVPSLCRTGLLVVSAALLGACATTPKEAVVPQAPSLASVVRGRFVSRVQLDDGDLVVVPAGKLKPRVTAQTAQALFDAADVVNGAYRFAILGLGKATIAPDVSSTTTTTTTPGTTTTTGAGTGTTSPGATTTSTSPTSRSAVSTTTSTTGSTSTSGTGSSGTSTSETTLAPTPTAPAPPSYDNRLAWVGIAWGADCPARPGGPRLATRYVVVVIDAETGGSVVAYTSRSSLACSGPVMAPSISRPSELVSVPWQPVGPTSTSVRVTLPPCGTYFGWTELPGQSASPIQVVASKPFDPDCASKASSSLVVASVVPLGAAQAQVPHAPLGPVDGLRTLPGG